MEFEKAVYTVMEDLGSVALCVYVTGEITEGEECTIYTENDTALGIIYIIDGFIVWRPHVKITLLDIYLCAYNYVHLKYSWNTLPFQRIQS